MAQEITMGVILAVIAFLILLLYALVCGYWTLFFQVALAGVLVGITYSLGHWFWGWAWPLAGRLQGGQPNAWWAENRARVVNFALIGLATILAGVVVWVLVSRIPMPTCEVEGIGCASAHTVPSTGTAVQGDTSRVTLTQGDTLAKATNGKMLSAWFDTTRIESRVERRGPDRVQIFTLKPGVPGDTSTVKLCSYPKGVHHHVCW